MNRCETRRDLALHIDTRCRYKLHRSVPACACACRSSPVAKCPVQKMCRQFSRRIQRHMWTGRISTVVRQTLLPSRKCFQRHRVHRRDKYSTNRFGQKQNAKRRQETTLVGRSIPAARRRLVLDRQFPRHHRICRSRVRHHPRACWDGSTITMRGANHRD